MNLLLILFLTLLNGLFAMSEMALAASRKARLDALANAQKPGASAALALMEQPTNFLSTVQVGITSISLLNGIVGDSAFSPIVGGWLLRAGLPERMAHFTATALVVAAITFVTLIFGELVPKRIGQLYPEQIAALMARPMTWLSRVARPFVLLLSNTTQAVLRLLPFDTQAARSVTQEEIAASLVEGVDAGLIEEQEHRMLRNVFKLDERELSSIMVPRNEVLWLDAQTTVAQALHNLASGHMRVHSWYPVCKGSLDEVVGIVGISQLVQPDNAPHALEDIATPASFVPETISGMELLEQFRGRAHRLVFVVDEYGEVQGILTPRDLLEAITGELHAHTAQEAWGTRQENGSWLFDGMIPVNELKNKLDIEETLPQEDENLYNTLGGLLMFVSGELPFAGQEVQCAGWRFVIQSLDGKRAEQIQAHKLAEDSGDL
ncbi:MAG: hemolysin family protein [Brachymonas sp.]|nr:hemolysin family protein [Brachymonas sp.]